MELQVGYWGDFFVESYEGLLTILSYEGSLEHVRVPVIIEGHLVHSIARGAFNTKFTEKLLKVDLPISIVSIKDGAFSENITIERYFNKDIEGFEFNSMWITDPYMDETGRFNVEPLDYYGIKVEKI